MIRAGLAARAAALSAVIAPAMRAALIAGAIGLVPVAMGPGAAFARDTAPPARPEGLGIRGVDATAIQQVIEDLGSGSGESDGDVPTDMQVLVPDAEVAAAPTAAPEAAPQTPNRRVMPRDPNRGQVTNMPLPRYVSLKSSEGNVRRGPGLSHRIDWVFKRAGMPLKITAEYEHWRRVEDADGMGGWVNFALLSGVRHVLIRDDLAEFRDRPDDTAAVSFKAEANVIGKLLECLPDWCRVGVEGEKGWIRKTALWGVDPTEVLE